MGIIRPQIKGKQADIYSYVDDQQRDLSFDFINELQSNDRKKILALLQRMASEGEIRNTEKFVCEENPIYAFKSFKVRIYCFFLPDAPKKTIVLTHGAIKKQDNADPNNILRAKRIYNEITTHLK